MYNNSVTIFLRGYHVLLAHPKEFIQSVEYSKAQVFTSMAAPMLGNMMGGPMATGMKRQLKDLVFASGDGSFPRWFNPPPGKSILFFSRASVVPPKRRCLDPPGTHPSSTFDTKARLEPKRVKQIQEELKPDVLCVSFMYPIFYALGEVLDIPLVGIGWAAPSFLTVQIDLPWATEPNVGSIHSRQEIYENPRLLVENTLAPWRETWNMMSMCRMCHTNPHNSTGFLSFLLLQVCFLIP